MEKKRKSKGDIFDFINDAAKNEELHKDMVSVITSKGEGLVANSFLKKFHDRGYKDVTLQDCKKLLKIIKKDIVNPSIWDWSY